MKVEALIIAMGAIDGGGEKLDKLDLDVNTSLLNGAADDLANAAVVDKGFGLVSQRLDHPRDFIEHRRVYVVCGQLSGVSANPERLEALSLGHWPEAGRQLNPREPRVEGHAKAGFNN